MFGDLCLAKIISTNEPGTEPSAETYSIIVLHFNKKYNMQTVPTILNTLNLKRNKIMDNDFLILSFTFTGL